MCHKPKDPRYAADMVNDKTSGAQHFLLRSTASVELPHLRKRKANSDPSLVKNPRISRLSQYQCGPYQDRITENSEEKSGS